MKRLSYYHRILAAYLTANQSQLTFWHTGPEVNPNFTPGELGEYYMPFEGKADYAGTYDQEDIPMLDYHGAVGVQYNPIAIAQYGLGNFNLFLRTGDQDRWATCCRAADWMVENLEENHAGLWMWMHHFDWEYRKTLQDPWYSALAQGQGLSLLARISKHTSDPKYDEALEKAFQPFLFDLEKGGVKYVDDQGWIWFEEYIVSPLPPTHVLNGFIWAAWGLYDYYLLSGKQEAQDLWLAAVDTLEHNLETYDIGFWSLYEQSGTRLHMIASTFYHQLHIVQLQILHRLTDHSVFARFADRWEGYQEKFFYRTFATMYKLVFKLLYY